MKPVSSTKSKLSRLSGLKARTESQIEDELQKKEAFLEEDCECDDPEPYDYTFKDGEWDEYYTVCLKCGGFL